MTITSCIWFRIIEKEMFDRFLRLVEDAPGVTAVIATDFHRVGRREPLLERAGGLGRGSARSRRGAAAEVRRFRRGDPRGVEARPGDRSDRSRCAAERSGD